MPGARQGSRGGARGEATVSIGSAPTLLLLVASSLGKPSWWDCWSRRCPWGAVSTRSRLG